jgi:hypothetical protein
MDDRGYREVGNGEVSEFGVLCEFSCLLYRLLLEKGFSCEDGAMRGVARNGEG